jgi:hypothetical protein
MNVNATASKSAKDRLAGELAERAYPVALRHGVKGVSIDVELEIWKAIETAVRRMPEPLLLMESSPPALDDVLARVTDAAYRVALRRGFRGAFLDLELDLWDAVHAGSSHDHPPSDSGLARILRWQ